MAATPPAVAACNGLDLPAHEAALEALAEGAATAATAIDEVLVPSPSPSPGADGDNPSIRFHACGVDASTTSRADIEAQLNRLDAARKLERRAEAARNSPTTAGAATATAAAEEPDEAILRMLALRKLQLMQLHLKTDNLPILVREATRTQGALYLGSVGASHHLANLRSHGITHVLSVGRNLAQPFPHLMTYLYVPMLDSSTTRITRDVFEATWEFIDKARLGSPSEPNSPEADQSAADVPMDITACTPVLTPALGLPTSMISAVARSSAATNGVPAALAQSEREEGAVFAARAATAADVTLPSADPSFAPVASSPGSVLVHCFAGKSRSTTILLAYLMYSERWSLDQAYAHVKKCRPTINPNPGFLMQLKELERQLFATPTTSDTNSTTSTPPSATTSPSPSATV